MAPIDPFLPIVLRHADVPLEAHILPMGANPVRLIYTDPTTGAKNDMIVGPEDPRDNFTYRAFLGPTIGRYANRLPAGHLKYNGGELDLAEFSAPGVALHGGPVVSNDVPSIEEGTLPPQAGPLDRIVYSRLSSEQAQLYGPQDTPEHGGTSLILGATSQGVAKGQQGYPGTLRIEARFTLHVGPPQDPRTLREAGTSAGGLTLEYRAALVDDGSGCEATPLNMTHHWAFNLSASDAEAREQEDGTIDKHNLRMYDTPGLDVPTGAEGRADGKQLWTPELDSKMVPTGKLVTCKPGGPHDFLHAGNQGLGRILKHDVSPPEFYDYQYIWGLKDDSVRGKVAHEGPRVVLTAVSTGMSLSFRTDQPAVQVYGTTGLPPKPSPADASSGGAKKVLHGGKGKTGNHTRSGVCLEFGAPHGTLLHPLYQKLAQTDTILRKGEQYRHFVDVELFVGGSLE